MTDSSRETRAAQCREVAFEKLMAECAKEVKAARERQAKGLADPSDTATAIEVFYLVDSIVWC